jgi:hypothetical protein
VKERDRDRERERERERDVAIVPNIGDLVLRAQANVARSKRGRQVTRSSCLLLLTLRFTCLLDQAQAGGALERGMGGPVERETI